MEKNVYDYAILGAGLTGLVTSLILKKNDPKSKVVVLEKNKFTGGLAASSKLGGITVDSIYIFPDIRNFLRRLDIETDLYQYKKAFYNIRLIDDDGTFEINLPPGRQEFLNVLAGRFPGEKDNVKKFLDFCFKMEDRFHNLRTEFTFMSLVKFIARSMTLVLNMNLSLSGLIKKFRFKDKYLVRIIESFSGLAQLPPGKLNAMIPEIAIVNLIKSSFRLKDSFDAFLEEIGKKMNDLMVDTLFKTEVTQITKENGFFKLTSVDKKEFFAGKVISTIDTKKLFLDILPHEMTNPGFLEKTMNYEMTLSAFVIKLIIRSKERYETDIGQTLFYGGRDTFKFLYDRAVNGNNTLDEKTFHFALTVKPVKDKEGLYSFELLAVPVSYEYWNDIKLHGGDAYGREIKLWEDFFIGKLERHYDKDIGKKISEKQSFTPLFFEKSFNLSEAALYDMAQTASQSGMKRLGFATPVRDLYHCKMVHGIYGSIYQAFLLSDLILKGRLNGYGYRWE